MIEYLFVLIPFGFAGGMFFASAKSVIRARLIEDVPTSTIRGAAQGYVELFGIAHADDKVPLFSKLSNSPCIWHSWKIEKHSNRDKGNGWDLVERGSSDAAIKLHDNTGVCFIHPDHAEVTTTRTKSWRGNTRLPLSIDNTASFSGRYRYTEQLLQDQDWLYVLGHFETLGAQDPREIAKHLTREIIREWKADQPSLIKRFDADGDGKIDLQEWEVARDAAAQEAEQEAFKLSAQPAVSIVRAQNVRNQPLMISDHDPKKLSRKYRWQALGFMFGGIIGCVFCWMMFR